MKCVDCAEDLTEPEKATAKRCFLCFGSMHAECAMETEETEDGKHQSVCEDCLNDPLFGGLLGKAGGVLL